MLFLPSFFILIWYTFLIDKDLLVVGVGFSINGLMFFDFLLNMMNSVTVSTSIGISPFSKDTYVNLLFK